MDRKMKIKVFTKLLDAGFDTEKAITDFGLKDMKTADIRGDEITTLLELQEAVRKNKVISFFANEKAGVKEGGENTWQR